MKASTDLVRLFTRAGFQLVRLNRHLIWRCPCGHRILTSPATPGRGRSFENMKADINRTLRACHAQKESA